MSAQPQYLIVANRRCKTHRPGTKLIYTGPRAGVARGWTVVGRVIETYPEGFPWENNLK